MSFFSFSPIRPDAFFKICSINEFASSRRSHKLFPREIILIGPIVSCLHLILSFRSLKKTLKSFPVLLNWAELSSDSWRSEFHSRKVIDHRHLVDHSILYRVERLLRSSFYGHCFWKCWWNHLNRQPEKVFVPQMFVPENGQSWQRNGCLLFQASRALALMRTWFSLQYPKEMR